MTRRLSLSEIYKIDTEHGRLLDRWLSSLQTKASPESHIRLVKRLQASESRLAKQGIVIEPILEEGVCATFMVTSPIPPKPVTLKATIKFTF